MKASVKNLIARINEVANCEEVVRDSSYGNSSQWEITENLFVIVHHKFDNYITLGFNDGRAIWNAGDRWDEVCEQFPSLVEQVSTLRNKSIDEMVVWVEDLIDLV